MQHIRGPNLRPHQNGSIFVTEISRVPRMHMTARKDTLPISPKHIEKKLRICIKLVAGISRLMTLFLLISALFP